MSVVVPGSSQGSGQPFSHHASQRGNFTCRALEPGANTGALVDAGLPVKVWSNTPALSLRFGVASLLWRRDGQRLGTSLLGSQDVRS